MNFKSKTAIFVASTIMLAPQAFADIKTESELGLATSYYRYQEPNFMSLRVINIGLNYIGTSVFQNDWFIRTDLAATVSGGVHYSSYDTGNMDGGKNWYTDIRALVGKNLTFENYALAPYVGFGYRYLYNDQRGISSTGNPGYRRASNYYYLPIGITHKLDLTSQSKLVINIEFDYFLRGKQRTYLSDFSRIQVDDVLYVWGRDITNKQKSGYGARFSTMYQIDNWSVGPYINYWHINASSMVFLPTTDMKYLIPFCEPKNNTIEAGLKISVLF